MAQGGTISFAGADVKRDRQREVDQFVDSTRSRSSVLVKRRESATRGIGLQQQLIETLSQERLQLQEQQAQEQMTLRENEARTEENQLDEERGNAESRLDPELKTAVSLQAEMAKIDSMERLEERWSVKATRAGSIRTGCCRESIGARK